MKHAFENGAKHSESFLKGRKRQNKRRFIHSRVINNFKIGQQIGDILLTVYIGYSGRTMFKAICTRCSKTLNYSFYDRTRRCKSCAVKKCHIGKKDFLKP